VTPVLVNGEVLGAEFVPDELLAAGTTYTLEISIAAQNLTGTPLEGAVRTEFTTGSSEDFRPPGTIAFATQTGSIWSISTSQADGSGRVRIASGTGWVGQLAWSPGGERLAFSMATSVEGTHIFVMDADGSNLVRRTDTGWSQSPTWSPDGRHIAFGSLRNNRTSWGVYVTDVDGDWRDVVLIGPSVPLDPMPAWSGDGTRIAFFDASRSAEVSLMSPDGSDVSQLRTDLVYTALGRPAWSPDGATIAVASLPGEHWWGEDIPSHLVLMATDGSGARLVPDWPGDVHSPVWSPDASVLGFANECEPGIQCIGFMALDGRISSVTIRDAFGAAWRP
jgi:dipeptidyl aminopeptidase/acylaminoacyl peptidase